MSPVLAHGWAVRRVPSHACPCDSLSLQAAGPTGHQHAGGERRGVQRGGATAQPPAEARPRAVRAAGDPGAHQARLRVLEPLHHVSRVSTGGLVGPEHARSPTTRGASPGGSSCSSWGVRVPCTRTQLQTHRPTRRQATHPQGCQDTQANRRPVSAKPGRAHAEHARRQHWETGPGTLSLAGASRLRVGVPVSARGAGLSWPLPCAARCAPNRVLLG